MIKLEIQQDEIYASDDVKPIEDDRIQQESLGKSGQLELKGWVLTVETWDEVAQFIRDNGGAAALEVPEEDQIGSIMLTGS